MAENIFIKELLDKPFAAHTINGKLRTTNKSRPTPLLPNVITQHETRQNDTKIFFHLTV